MAGKKKQSKLAAAGPAERGRLISLMMSFVTDEGDERVFVADAGWAARTGSISLDPAQWGGRITKLVMAFEYPDGSGKIASYGPEWIAATASLIWDPAQMNRAQQKRFAPGPDWEQNPAMTRVLVNFHTICLRAGHGGDDQQY